MTGVTQWIDSLPLGFQVVATMALLTVILALGVWFGRFLARQKTRSTRRTAAPPPPEQQPVPTSRRQLDQDLRSLRRDLQVVRRDARRVPRIPEIPPLDLEPFFRETQRQFDVISEQLRSSMDEAEATVSRNVSVTLDLNDASPNNPVAQEVLRILNEPQNQQRLVSAAGGSATSVAVVAPPASTAPPAVETPQRSGDTFHQIVAELSGRVRSELRRVRSTSEPGRLECGCPAPTAKDPSCEKHVTSSPKPPTWHERLLKDDEESP